jgi:hypothetical protein
MLGTGDYLVRLGISVSFCDLILADPTQVLDEEPAVVLNDFIGNIGIIGEPLGFSIYLSVEPFVQEDLATRRDDNCLSTRYEVKIVSLGIGYVLEELLAGSAGLVFEASLVAVKASGSPDEAAIFQVVEGVLLSNVDPLAADSVKAIHFLSAFQLDSYVNRATFFPVADVPLRS